MGVIRNALIVGILFLGFNCLAGEKVIVSVAGHPVNVITVTKQDGTVEKIPMHIMSEETETPSTKSEKLQKVICQLESEGFTYIGPIGQNGSAASLSLFEKK